MATSADITTVTNGINTYIKENANEEITGNILNTILLQLLALVPVVYEDSFENGDLDGNYEIEIEHDLDTSYPTILLINGSGIVQGPAAVDFTITDANTVKFSFHTSITGTWYCKITKDD